MEPGMSTVNYQEKRGDFDEPETPTIEYLAEEQLAKMDEKAAAKLVTPLRSTWTRSQTVTMKVDTITKMEVNLVAGDNELQKLAIQKRLIENRIMDRIDEILNDYRELPYQVSENGARIDLEKYDVPQLKLCCPKKGLDLELDLFNMVGYLRPISKGMTTEGAIPVIKDVLKGALVHVEKPLPGEQLEAHLASKGE